MTVTVNLNDRVTVRLTAEGDRLVRACGWVYEPKIPPVGEPFTTHLWILMRALGGSFGMAREQTIVGNVMVIADEP